MSDAAKLTVEDLMSDGFGEKPFFHCCLADVSVAEQKTGSDSRKVR